MAIFKYYERLTRLHDLIKRKATGTPLELSNKLGLSKRQTLEVLSEIKDMNISIKYCKVSKTYFYEQEVLFNFEYKMLSKAELQKVEGGNSKILTNSFTPLKFY